MKIRFSHFGLIFFLLFFCNCKQGPIPSTTGTIDASLPTTEEASSSIASTFSQDGYGLSIQLTDASNIGRNGNFSSTFETNHNKTSVNLDRTAFSTVNTLGQSLCGLVKDTLFKKVYTLPDSTKYNYTLAYHAQVLCSQNQINSIIFVDSTSGTYQGPLLNFEGTSIGKFSSSFPSGAGDSVIEFNGTYIRNGSSQSKFMNKSIFSSQLTFNISNLRIGKITHFISGGTGEIEIQGVSNREKVFRYLGSVDFSTPNMVAISLEGYRYVYNLKTGKQVSAPDGSN